MKKKSFVYSAAVLLFFLQSCQNPSGGWNAEQDQKRIQEVMSVQQDAWNNADIDSFMSGYWRNDSLRFIGKSGVTYGWQPTLENYKRGYPDKESMGRLQFTNLSVEVADSTHAFVIGKWELFRVSDTLSGHYSLLWRKMNGSWVIVTDHSS